MLSLLIGTCWAFKGALFRAWTQLYSVVQASGAQISSVTAATFHCESKAVAVNTVDLLKGRVKKLKALPLPPLRTAVEVSTVTQQVSADLRTFRSNISSKRGKEDVYTLDFVSGT